MSCKSPVARNHWNHFSKWFCSLHDFIFILSLVRRKRKWLITARPRKLLYAFSKCCSHRLFRIGEHNSCRDFLKAQNCNFKRVCFRISFPLATATHRDNFLCFPNFSFRRVHVIFSLARKSVCGKQNQGCTLLGENAQLNTLTNHPSIRPLFAKYIFF